MIAWQNRGVPAALGAAFLFGAGTPAAKLLLGPVSPWLLAGLLYLGSGLGLMAWRLMQPAQRVSLTRSELGWLAGAIVSGGIVGPVLLMWGLASMPASGASLLLNAEGVFTAMLAWFVFKENFDRRIALGMALIVAGAVVLSWPGKAEFSVVLPTLAVLGACFAWGVDNNLTRKVSLSDATFVAMTKGLAAGVVNTGLALLAGGTLPGMKFLIAAGGIGFLSYGISLALFVVALRNLGTARTGAYFSTAPFAGALIAVTLLDESMTIQLILGGLLMAVGVWLHLMERHDHVHAHELLEHEHAHDHDEHHRHAHPIGSSGVSAHSHPHVHEPSAHSHPHFPDVHHRHSH